ncbi:MULTISPECIES: ferritin [Ectothiorhodospira]|nr:MULTISPECIES: ferritin [Ectothiorhodospira]MCG5494867.1 ferritin [Ectothiorhodospira variabilis]MCG5497728.1 ferritin [Ectothiorhodospira variabilis]MCG5504380.1 ferritin [Ectothiorhodospira variabilis]MCG5507535.1 ferritin [Ectothiorhodospira variabilis]MCG5525215.1 ferritin [Ectothiorhodospira haloalkaliphila]
MLFASKDGFKAFSLHNPEVFIMISTAMAEKISNQINREFYSAYLYLALSTEADNANLRGAAEWFMAKYHEESAHGLKMVRYLLDQGAEVTHGAITAPPSQTGSLLAMFERTLEHEQQVTAAIHDIVDQALSEKDHATNIFMHWFVTEQIEEEATVSDILGRLRLFGDRSEGLLMIDNELAAAAKSMGQGESVA